MALTVVLALLTSLALALTGDAGGGECSFGRAM